MGAWKTYRNNLYTILDEVTSIKALDKEPKLDFQQYPAAFIAPSGIASDYETNIENMRVYAFKVWVLVELKQTGSEDAYNEILDAVDDIVNKIDEQSQPDSGRELADSIPAGYTLINVFAVPGEMIPDEVQGVLATSVTVRLQTLVDLTQI